MNANPIEALKVFVPLNSLTPENLATLAASTPLEDFSVGQEIFHQGDLDAFSIYVLKGTVEMVSSGSSIKREVTAGTEEARYALAQLKPRQYTGIAKTPVTVARVDSLLLDRLLTFEQTTGIEVTEYDGAEDNEWMMGMLKSEILQKLPAGNINALFARMEPIEMKAGQPVIKQGEPGDYYYIIKEGRVNVSRKSDSSGKVVILGELREGDGFGEEALLSGAPRNANVVMMSEGVLMRLAKSDFDELLKEPLVRWVSEQEAKDLVRMGAVLLDVRLEDEYRSGHLRGSVNIPLYLLRLKAKALDPKRQYVVYCQSGSRSCSAAFLLTQRGFEVHVIKGGLQALSKIG